MTGKELKPSPTKLKVLFILQEMIPYTPVGESGKISRELPQHIQELGREIRIMMPLYGSINLRSHQLHEVYRLSKTTVTINGDEKPLLIRIGAIPSAKIQTYFIDTDELFKRKYQTRDENNSIFKDTDERILFFCKGVIETVKQLNWSPDIIHCHGWMTSLVPLLIKSIYKNDPLFSNSKVIYTLFNDHFNETLDAGYQKKLEPDGIKQKDSKELSQPTFENITKNAISNSDAVIIGSENVHVELNDYIQASQSHLLNYPLGENTEEVNNFYERILKGSNS